MPPNTGGGDRTHKLTGLSRAHMPNSGTPAYSKHLQLTTIILQLPHTDKVTGVDNFTKVPCHNYLVGFVTIVYESRIGNLTGSPHL